MVLYNEIVFSLSETLSLIYSQNENLAIYLQSKLNKISFFFI